MDLCQEQDVTQPVYPGIMPIGNFDTLKRFSKNCGAEIPRWIKKSMSAYEGDPESQRKLGLDIVTDLSQKLLDGGAPGLHFYTMNQSRLTRHILQNLDLID